MEIIEKKVEDLIPYENNPRKNDSAVQFVANSIKEFGFKVPVVIDKGNTIVCGHTRLKAAQQLGLETVPCVIADDLSEEQIKAFRLADNKTSEFASWDFEKLELEMQEIEAGLANLNMEDFGFGSSGINSAEIDDLFDEESQRPKKEVTPAVVHCKCPECGTEWDMEI